MRDSNLAPCLKSLRTPGYRVLRFWNAVTPKGLVGASCALAPLPHPTCTPPPHPMPPQRPLWCRSWYQQYDKKAVGWGPQRSVLILGYLFSWDQKALGLNIFTDPAVAFSISWGSHGFRLEWVIAPHRKGQSALGLTLAFQISRLVLTEEKFRRR